MLLEQATAAIVEAHFNTTINTHANVLEANEKIQQKMKEMVGCGNTDRCSCFFLFVYFFVFLFFILHSFWDLDSGYGNQLGCFQITEIIEIFILFVFSHGQLQLYVREHKRKTRQFLGG